MTGSRATYAADYATPAAPSRFAVGDTVRHPFYGRGQVIEIQTMPNGDTQYRVEFAVVKRWLYPDNLKKEASARKV